MKCYKCKQDMKKIDDDNYVCEKCGVGSITLKSNPGYFTDIRDIKIANLEHQLAEKDKEIEFLTKQNKALVEGAKQMLYEGKEAMREVMKDVRGMSGGNAMTVFNQNVLLDLYEQEVRHQVCEEIREKINSKCFATDIDTGETIPYDAIFDANDIREILDQIEGENK